MYHMYFAREYNTYIHKYSTFSTCKTIQWAPKAPPSCMHVHATYLPPPPPPQKLGPHIFSPTKGSKKK